MLCVSYRQYGAENLATDMNLCEGNMSYGWVDSGTYLHTRIYGLNCHKFCSRLLILIVIIYLYCTVFMATRFSLPRYCGNFFKY